jgi:hypothetical protein
MSFGFRPIVFILLLIAAAPGRAFAQSQELRDAQAEVARLRQELAALREQYDARLTALEQKLGTAPAATPTPVPTPAPEPAPTAPGSSAVGPGSSKVFNPDISAIANFVGIAGKNDAVSQPAFNLTEVETSLQAIVDPYARADFFLSAGPEGLEVEEGYATFNSLPGQLLLKAGKMRANFGKMNTMHTHAISTADRPLVTQNLVGGEEGISEPGVSLSRLISNSALFLEATGEAYYGSSPVFQARERSQLTYVARLRGYRDVTEGTNLDIGGSYAYGPSAVAASARPGLDEAVTELFGVDATFRYRPLRRAIYRRFLGRTELIWSRPKLGGMAQDASFGLYGSADYQFARRWFVGGRYDRSARALDPNSIDNGASFTLTFWPSEFSVVRGQYRHTNYAEGIKANEVLFQMNFSIGAHGAHVF